jgi:hypothetical protein
MVFFTFPLIAPEITALLNGSRYILRSLLVG